MKIKGLLVDILVQMDSEKFGPNLVYEKVNKVLYIEVLKAIYYMLQSYLFSYIKMRKYLCINGFKFNTCDPCVANNIIEREPLIVVFRAYNAKSIHKYKKVVDKF